MSLLNTSALATKVIAIGVDAANAATIVSEVVSLIGIVEQVYQGLSGAVKASAVLSALDAVIAQLGLTAKLAQIKAACTPLINLIVAVLNGGSLWQKLFDSIAQAATAAAAALAPKAPIVNTAASQAA